MGFEIYVPSGVRTDGIKPGQASVNCAGTLTVATSDMHRLGVVGAATVLLDVMTGRIALRKPKPSELMTLKVKYSKSKTTALINLKRPLLKIGVDPKKVKGRYAVEHKDDLFIVAMPVGKSK